MTVAPTIYLPPGVGRDIVLAKPRRARLESPPALTASSARVTKQNGQDFRRLIQPWQARAMSYYDMIGEVWYCSQFYSRALAKTRLFPAILDDNGDPEETDDKLLTDLWSRVQEPGGGRGQLQASYGRLMFITGEGYLTVTPDPDWGEAWEFLSSDELRVQPGGIFVRYTAPQLDAETFVDAPDDAFEPIPNQAGPDAIVPYRLWRKHPRYSAWSDSPMRAVLDLCVAEGTLISTERGPIPVENIEIGDNVFTWTAGGLGLSPVVRHLERGEQPILKITAGRRTIEATGTHPLLVLRKSKPGKGFHADYNLEWVPADQIALGDYLICSGHLPDYGTDQKMPDGTPIDTEIAWLLGQIIGDGHVHQEGLNISVFAGDRERICTIMRNSWGLEDHPTGGVARFFSRSLRRTLTRMGLRVYSHEKRIPAEVLAAPQEIKRAFLAGYEDADGHLTKQGWQSMALASPRLARELRALYIELGENVSNIHIESRPAVMAMPGGYTTENARPLHRFQVYYNPVKGGSKLVMQAKIAQEAIGGEHFTVERVKKIDAHGIALTYDLEVRDAHNYFADGVVSHNCEEILLLTLAVRSRAKSRAANGGLLLWPDESSFPQLDTSGDEDPTNDPFFDELAESMMAPISDPGTASAAVPMLVRLGKDIIRPEDGGPRLMQLVDPKDNYGETGLRTEAIRRFALGVDLPPEQLLGMTDANHWSGWLIDEQSWKAHLMPVTQAMCDDFNSAYLRPAAREAGFANWKNVAIGYDATEVINHPDKGKDYLDLYNARAIGKSALRIAKGATDDDAPSEDELNEMIGVAIRDGSFAKYGIPSVRSAIEPEAGDIEAPTGASDTPVPDATGADNEPGPPAGGEPEPRAPVTASADRILGAAEMAVERCRELAGTRLVRRVRNAKCAPCLEKIKSLPSVLIASALGAATCNELYAEDPTAGEPRELVTGGTQAFVASAVRLGINSEAAGDLADIIELHAARTLHDEQPAALPAGFYALLQRIAA